MRIISGCRRGHKLHEFAGMDVRPTTDRVKEAIFNLIQTYVPNAKVLDMFAGSGALSLEALSRGAESAVLVDIDRESVNIINKNIAELRFGELCKVVTASFSDFAKNCRDKFDIIFLDPPYNKGFIEPALSLIAENSLLSENGIVVLESDNTDFKSEIETLQIIKQKKYGRTFVTIYERFEDGNFDI